MGLKIAELGNVNADLIPFLLELGQWFVDGLIGWKEDEALDAQMRPIFTAMIAENRGPTPAEAATIQSIGQAEHDTSQGTEPPQAS